MSWRYRDSQTLFVSLNVDFLVPSWESLMRWSSTLACTRTSACMHLRVIFACFLTLWPLTKACNFTSPLSARSALLAYTNTRSYTVTQREMAKYSFFLQKIQGRSVDLWLTKYPLKAVWITTAAECSLAWLVGLVSRATSTAAWAVAIAASAVATATASACFRSAAAFAADSWFVDAAAAFVGVCCGSVSWFVGFLNIHLRFSLFCGKNAG